MATATAVAAQVAPAAASVKKAPKQLPAPNSDFYEVYGTLNAEELATVKKVRAFMEAKVAPVIVERPHGGEVRAHRCEQGIGDEPGRGPVARGVLFWPLRCNRRQEGRHVRLPRKARTAIPRPLKKSL